MSLFSSLRCAGRVASTCSTRAAVRIRLLSTTDDSREAFITRSEGDNAGIAFLSLNRPQAKNALSMRLIKELAEALDEIRFDGTTRVLILRSSSPNAFCSGADLKERRTMDQTQVSKFLHDMRQTMSRLEDLPMPTVAAIDGPALGGGLELALCCDLRIANPSVANIGLVETRLAIIPGAGGTVRATRLLGPAKAKDLIFSARVLNAQQAHQVGLIDYLSDGAGQSATDRAIAWAREVLPNGPIAIRAAKQAIDTGSQLDVESALDFERQCYQSTITTEDRLEGLKAFAEKRKPKYLGR